MSQMVWFKTLQVQFPLPPDVRQVVVEFSMGGPGAENGPPAELVPYLDRWDAPDPRTDHDPPWPLWLADDPRPGRFWED
jgi:hypothetical protein